MSYNLYGSIGDQFRKLKTFTKEPTIAYFQAKIPPYIANREMRGNTINYNTMTSKLGWN